MNSDDGPETELALDARATVAEGPVWDDRRRVLWWVDVLVGFIHAFDPALGTDHAISVGSAVGAIALRPDGTLLVAAQDRLAILDPESGRLESLLELGPELPHRRMNDGKCDPMGRFWVGRMTFDGAAGGGSLLRLDTACSLTTVLTGLATPNGLAWSPDGGRMYLIDSARPEVATYVFDAATGSIHGGHRLVRFPDDGSFPDGMTIDAEGFLWVAMWGAGCIRRVSTDGRVVGQIKLPVARVTSCAFGGDDLRDLFVTTAQGNDDPAEAGREPLAGGVFRAHPGVRGLPPIRFAG